MPQKLDFGKTLKLNFNESRLFFLRYRGGFDLAAEWMGWNNVLKVEIDPFCRRVLKHHFPNAEQHTDIRTFDGSTYRGTVDIVSGGFPCQPYSVAGKRLHTRRAGV